MDADAQRLAVDVLLGAYVSGIPVEPLTEKFPGLTGEDSYAIQAAQVDSWVGDGRRVVGHKVGLTSRVMQRQFGVDQPDYGHLLNTMFHLDGQPIAASGFLQP
uniref:2-keto-4-pentenoate hydratase n=1 Tax=Frankia sp. Cr1 TaxID=3073931 RepID=UPI003A0FD406